MARRLLYSVRSRKHQLLREIQDKTKLLQSVSFYHLCGRKSAPRPPAYSTASSPLTLVKTADSGSCRLQFCGTESLIKSEPFSRVKGKHPFTQRPDFCSETTDKCSRMCRHLFQQTPQRAGLPRLCAHVFSRRISAPACFNKKTAASAARSRGFSAAFFCPGTARCSAGRPQPECRDAAGRALKTVNLTDLSAACTQPIRSFSEQKKSRRPIRCDFLRRTGQPA